MVALSCCNGTGHINAPGVDGRAPELPRMVTLNCWTGPGHITVPEINWRASMLPSMVTLNCWSGPWRTNVPGMNRRAPMLLRMARHINVPGTNIRSPMLLRMSTWECWNGGQNASMSLEYIGVSLCLNCRNGPERMKCIDLRQICPWSSPWGVEGEVDQDTSMSLGRTDLR